MITDLQNKFKAMQPFCFSTKESWVDAQEDLWDAMVAFVKLHLLYFSTHGRWSAEQWRLLQEPILNLTTAQRLKHKPVDATPEGLKDLALAIEASIKGVM